jgi:hypothetical protein
VIVAGHLGGDRSSGIARRAIGALLLLVLIVGAFALWVGVPAAVLWGLGKAVDDPTEHLVLGVIAVPTGMAAFALVLATVNTVYLRVNGVLVPGDEHDEWRPRFHGPLDRIMGISAVICLVAFTVWILFGSAWVSPPGAGAW